MNNTIPACSACNSAYCSGGCLENIKKLAAVLDGVGQDTLRELLISAGGDVNRAANHYFGVGEPRHVQPQPLQRDNQDEDDDWSTPMLPLERKVTSSSQEAKASQLTQPTKNTQPKPQSAPQITASSPTLPSNISKPTSHTTKSVKTTTFPTPPPRNTTHTSSSSPDTRSSTPFPQSETSTRSTPLHTTTSPLTNRAIPANSLAPRPPTTSKSPAPSHLHSPLSSSVSPSPSPSSSPSPSTSTARPKIQSSTAHTSTSVKSATPHSEKGNDNTESAPKKRKIVIPSAVEIPNTTQGIANDSVQLTLAKQRELEITQQINEKATRLEKLTQQMSAKEVEFNQLLQKIKNGEGELHQQIQLNEEEKKKRKELIQRTATAQQLYTNVQLQLDKTNADLESAQQQIIISQRQLEKLQADFALTQQQMEPAQQQLTDTNKELLTKRKRLNTENKKLEEKQKALENVDAELTAKRQQLADLAAESNRQEPSQKHNNIRLVNIKTEPGSEPKISKATLKNQIKEHLEILDRCAKVLKPKPQPDFKADYTLNKYMSPNARELFDRRSIKAPIRFTKVPPDMKAKVKDFIIESIEENRCQGLVQKACERFTIPENDPRKALRGSNGLRATKNIPAGSILGIYVGKVFEESEFLKLVNSDLSNGAYIESYSFDTSTKVDGKTLLIDCSEFGSLLRYTNDSQKNPMEDYDLGASTQNAMWGEVQYKGWPYIIAYTLEDIYEGTEILADYSKEYWVPFKSVLQRKQSAAKERQLLLDAIAIHV